MSPYCSPPWLPVPQDPAPFATPQCPNPTMSFPLHPTPGSVGLYSQLPTPTVGISKPPLTRTCDMPRFEQAIRRVSRMVSYSCRDCNSAEIAFAHNLCGPYLRNQIVVILGILAEPDRS